MKRAVRLLMVFLSYSPIATVAVAAQAKASELDGEAQVAKFLSEIKGARYRLLPTYQMNSSMEEARARYAKITGLTGDEADQRMMQDLVNLSNAGLIQFNEKGIAGSGPSEHASSGF